MFAGGGISVSLAAHMRKNRLQLVLVAVLCATGAAAQAQSFTPQKIAFAGAKGYADADLLAISGMKPGTPVTGESINAAAKKLADSGYFSKIGFQYDGRTLTFDLEPMAAENLLTVRYLNLVWWTPEEINAELHRRHPLFEGKVPASGSMQDAILADLKDMLAAKGVTAEVEMTVPESTTATTVVEYSLVTPRVRVGRLQVDGLGPEFDSVLAAARPVVEGQDYSDLESPGIVIRLIEDALKNEGYMGAVVKDYRRSSTPVLEDGAVMVDLAVTAQAGEVYRIASVQWTPTELLSEKQFEKISALTPGEKTSLKLADDTRRAVDRVYTTQGYMDAKVNISAKPDAATHTAAYTVAVQPGERYTLHTMTLDGVTDAQRTEFMKTWKMQPGMPYSTAYVESFLTGNSAVLHTLDGYVMQWRIAIHDDTRTVDLKMTVKRRGEK